MIMTLPTPEKRLVVTQGTEENIFRFKKLEGPPGSDLEIAASQLCSQCVNSR